MRFYSDELKKFFDTEEECLSAEETAKVEAEEKKVTKAKLAKAKKKVAELQKEYDDKVDAIMNPAHDLIKECTKARAEAIKEFNDNFGVYTTTYTGNKALNEFAKTASMIDQFWKRFYY